MSRNKQKSANSSNARQEFTDWSWKQDNPYDHSDEAILEHHGNRFDEPDSNNATVIPHHEIKKSDDLNQEYWKKLDLYNGGVINWKWTNNPLITYQLNKVAIEALISQLNLTQSQRDRVYSYVMGLDLRKKGVKAELTMYCAIAAIVHNDETNINCHPNQKEIDKQFERVLDSLEFSDSEVQSHYNKHAQEIRKGNTEPPNNYMRFEKRKDIKPAPNEEMCL